MTQEESWGVNGMPEPDQCVIDNARLLHHLRNNQISRIISDGVFVEVWYSGSNLDDVPNYNARLPLLPWDVMGAIADFVKGRIEQ